MSIAPWMWLHIWKPAALESLVSPGLLPMGSDIQRPLVLRSSRPDWERNQITWVGEVHCLRQSYNIIFGFPFHTYQVGEVSQGNCPGGRPVGDPSLQCFLVVSVPEKGDALQELDQIVGSQLMENEWPYLIFVIFSPRTLFLAKIFSTQSAWIPANQFCDKTA